MKKRVLSLILALSMLIALLPAQTFAAGDPSLQVIGEVPAFSVGSSDVIEIGLFEGGSQGSITELGSITMENSNPEVADVVLEHTGSGEAVLADFAAYAAKSEKTIPKSCTVAEDGFALAISYSLHDNFFAWKENHLSLMMLSSGQTLDVTLSVPESGYYAASIQGLAGSDGALCDVYAGETLLGSYNFQAAGDAALQPEQALGMIYLEKGENTVTLQKAGGKNYVRLSKLSLVPIGDTVKLSVTAKQAGYATVNLSGDLDGADVLGSVEFAVKGEPGILALPENPTALEGLVAGEKTSVKLALTLDGLPAADEIEIRDVSADDPMVLDPSVRYEDDGVYLDLAAICADSTNLNITIYNEQYGEKTAVIPVTVAGKEYVYNFLKLHTGPQWHDAVELTSVTDWSMTTAGDPNEITPGSEQYTDPWIYIREKGTGAYFAFIVYGLMMDVLPGNWIEFGIDVKTSGSYLVSVDCLDYTAGGVIQGYIAPFDAENPRDDKYKVGNSINLYAVEQVNISNHVMGNTYLEAGKYIFSIAAPGMMATTTLARCGISAIHLEIPEGRTFDFTAENTKFMIEEETTIEISPRCNHYPIPVEKLSEYTITNQNEEILTVSDRVEDGKIILDAYGLKTGDATITVSGVYYDGTPFSTDIAVTTVPRDELKSADLSAPVSYAQAGETVQLTATATQYDGTVVHPGDDNVEFFYLSSDSNILSIDENGLLTAKGMGDATITLIAKRGSVEVEAEIPFSVTTYYPLQSVELNGLAGIEQGSVAQYTVSGRLENGAPLPENVDVEWIIVSNDDGAIELSESGAVSAVAEGTAVIKAKVTMFDGSFLETPEKTVTVYARSASDEEEEEPVAEEIYFNLRDMYRQSTAPKDVTLEEYGWRINPDLSSPAVMNNDIKQFRWQSYGLCLGINNNDDVAVFDINVPVAGWYELEVGAGKCWSGPQAEFFMNGKYLGEYDMYDPTLILAAEDKVLNSVYLTEGVNHLYIKRKATNKNLYLLLGSLRFTPVEEEPVALEVALKASRSTMSVGQTAKLLPGTQLSNGRVEWIGYTGDTMVPDPNNTIQSLTVSGDSITLKDNVITAVKPGESVITMKAMIGGTYYEKTLTITVDDQQLTTLAVALETQEVHIGEKPKINVTASFGNGNPIDLSELTLTCTSNDESVAKVVDGVLETYKEGSVQITVSATLGSVTLTTVLPVEVLGPALKDVKIKSPHSSIQPDDDGYQLTLVGVSSADADMELPESATVVWSTTTPELVEVNAETGFLTPKALGEAKVKAEVSYQGSFYYPELTILVREGKTKSTYYNEERMAAVKNNIANNEWARTIRKDAIDAADEWLAKHQDLGDYFYNNVIHTQEIPRGITVGLRWDPQAYTCKYCDTDLRDEHGAYSWEIDTINYPWKIQCPECRRRFPSNDFSKFYEAGRDEHGNFSYEKALKDGSQYLTNDLYPERGEGWSVDDSRGYRTGYYYPDRGVNIATYENLWGYDLTKMEETWTYIAYYAQWGVWRYDVPRVIRSMRDAYLYTGDKKYGRVGAILVDRLADVYPEMFTKPWFVYFNSDGHTPTGKMMGSIWQTGTTSLFVQAYDAFYEMYEDPYVINYLSKKAAEMNLDEDYYVPDYFSWDYDVDGYLDPNYEDPLVLKPGNPKNTAQLIRENIEENLVHENIRAVYEANEHGNFGTHQQTMAIAAVVLDSMPTTGEAIEWLMESAQEDDDKRYITMRGGDGRNDGGDVIRHITESVFRDGSNLEGAPNYAKMWPDYVYEMIYALAGYDGYDGVNLLENPKVMMLFKQHHPLFIQRNKTASIGDSGSYDGDFYLSLSEAVFMESNDVEMGQLLYWENGNKIEGLHGTIFEDSKELQARVKAIIDEYGEFDFDRSEQATGWGFSIVRNGTRVGDLVKPYDSQRFNYIYAGLSGGGHGHQDKLNFGIGAFGIDFSPDFGYPESADGAYRSQYRDRNSITSNLVLVNDKRQQQKVTVGFPLHFDDSERVSLIDMRDTSAYAEVEEYRRSTMMIEVDDMNAYTVDFFRVKGGDSHVYNFHAASDTVADTGDLNFVTQKRGTYAGESVPLEGNYGLGIYNGYDFLYDVRRAEYPGREFTVDFKINVFEGYTREDNYHLKVSQLNDFDITEVALATTQPPQKFGNPEENEFILVRRDGKDLDSLFTTVFEPYDTESYIASQESVSMERIGGAWETEADAAKAVKITLKNGRVDYIVYATNKDVLYRVDDRFEFQGFAGVYMLESETADTPMYLYLNDGTKIGDMEGSEGYTGTVVDFTKDAVLDNSITVSINEECDPYSLIGEYIYINNDGKENGVYKIEDVEVLDGGNVKIKTGMISYIRGMVDGYDIDKGYTYNIAEGQTFTIPITTVDDDSPVWDEIKSQAVVVGNTLAVPLNAVAPSGSEVTYAMTEPLRGANIIDGVFYFAPDNSQAGTNHVGIIAKNGALETSIHFAVEVYPATSGGGGGGGGGGGSSEEPPVEDDPIAPGEKFVDLGNHAWAKDAIYRLVEAGVIKGVADDRFAPAAQITRADFAILLVRAWKLTADKIGTYDDVAASDYFANEVGIAAANGIVKGVGEGKFAPRAPITREQMMVMLHRTLTAQGIKLDAADEAVLATFSDADAISDYAVDAVKLMVANGYIQGSNGKINPQGNATRAEVAVLLDRILNK